MRVKKPALVLSVFFFCVASCSFAHAVSRLSKAQINNIVSQIQKSKELSDKSVELYRQSLENNRVASANFERISLDSFRKSADAYLDSQVKFLEARKLFDDARIQMQQGLENYDLSFVSKGVAFHNQGVAAFNEGLGVLKRAQELMKNPGKETASPPVRSVETSTPPSPGPQMAEQPKSAPPMNSRNWFLAARAYHGFPLVAMIVLLGTVATSLQVFQHSEMVDKFILHPWSIVQHKARYYTMLTSGLIHADAMHLSMNLMSFCFFAFLLESLVGHVDFLIIYFGSMILAHWW